MRNITCYDPRILLGCSAPWNLTGAHGKCWNPNGLSRRTFLWANKVRVVEWAAAAHPEWIELPDPHGERPIHHAARLDDPAVARVLLSFGADPSAADDCGFGRTALHVVAEGGSAGQAAVARDWDAMSLGEFFFCLPCGVQCLAVSYQSVPAGVQSLRYLGVKMLHSSSPSSGFESMLARSGPL